MNRVRVGTGYIWVKMRKSGRMLGILLNVLQVSQRVVSFLDR